MTAGIDTTGRSSVIRSRQSRVTVPSSLIVMSSISPVNCRIHDGTADPRT
jgi:hypothetical protein